MHNARNNWLISIVLVALSLTLAGCSALSSGETPFTPGSSGGPTATPIPPTPLPPPPKTLVVCLASEPASLYIYSPLRLYGEANRAADLVLEAIYDGPIDVLGYRYQVVILEKTSSLADGDARLEAVSVSRGDLYLNPETLLPATLDNGMPYLPSGCTSPDCTEIYRSGQVSMDRLVVDFHLLAGLVWSDGQPLTASDSVFSYRLSAHRDSPIGSYLIDRTASYVALDSQTVRWTGIPGFIDSEYASNFWTPLPEHVLGGASAAELQQSEEANRRPLGWGPYVIDEWRAGEEIVLERNPSYFRSAEGLPRFEYLIFRFIGDEPESGLQQLLTGECDVLDDSVLDGVEMQTLLDLQESGDIRLASVPGPIVERIEFNLDPVVRPATNYFFRDVDLRRAIAGCIDRQAIVDEVMGGMGQVTDTYLPANHPFYAADVEAIVYDPAGAAQQLEALGWVDADGLAETPRVARGVAGVRLDTPLTLSLLTSTGTFQQSVAARIQQDLAACGVEVEIQAVDPAILLSPWPDGPVYGRSFHAAEWAWLTSVSPPCEEFASQEVASDETPDGSNASGFSDGAYDQACRAVLLGLPSASGYAEAVHQTQLIFAEELPALPLFARPRVVAYRADVCGLQVDPSAYSVLWNLESLDAGEACGN